MATVHAYRRTKKHTVDLTTWPGCGQKIEFHPNVCGEVVAEVDGPALKRLLELAEGYRLLGEAPAEDEDGDDEAVLPFVITDGEETVDLRTLDKAALMKFAADNEIAVHPNAKEDTIRNRIVDALNRVE